MNSRLAPAAILLALCFAGEWKNERADLGSCLDSTKLLRCAETLFVGKPFHIAAGNLAPGNGFGAGLAVLDHWSSKKNWRNNWLPTAPGARVATRLLPPASTSGAGATPDLMQTTAPPRKLAGSVPSFMPIRKPPR